MRHVTTMTSDEFVCLAFLEALEAGLPLPDGCDSTDMAEQGLIDPVIGGTWALTALGRLRLRNLRSTVGFGQ